MKGNAQSIAAAILPVVTSPRARLYQNLATTSIASSASAFTPVTFDTEASDTYNGFTAGGSAYTCPAGWDGIWDVFGVVVFATNATGKRYAGIGLNGASPQNGSQVGSDVVSSGVLALHTRALVFMAGGDMVQLLALQSSGAALATAIFLPLTSSMSLRWIAKS